MQERVVGDVAGRDGLAARLAVGEHPRGHGGRVLEKLAGVLGSDAADGVRDGVTETRDDLIEQGGTDGGTHGG